MTNRKLCTDAEFIRLFETSGARGVAKALGCDIRSVYSRRRSIEKLSDVVMMAPRDAEFKRCGAYRARIPLSIDSGSVVVFSDAHYWPGKPDCGHRALIHVIKEIKPKFVIANGDLIDGARIGRHPPIGYSYKPTLQAELETVEARINEIQRASKAKLVWCVGNHCLRFESRLAQNSAEFEGVSGFKLTDHFPTVEMGVSAWINDAVVVKHRYKGGLHATHNNTVTSGKSMVTGHLHSLKVTPYDDYTGHTATNFFGTTRFGVDTGTLSDPWGEHTDYIEDNPRNHRQGFVVLSFYDGKLLWPEIVARVGEAAFQFRGKVFKV